MSCSSNDLNDSNDYIATIASIYDSLTIENVKHTIMYKIICENIENLIIAEHVLCGTERNELKVKLDKLKDIIVKNEDNIIEVIKYAAKNYADEIEILEDPEKVKEMVCNHILTPIDGWDLTL